MMLTAVLLGSCSPSRHLIILTAAMIKTDRASRPSRFFRTNWSGRSSVTDCYVQPNITPPTSPPPPSHMVFQRNSSFWFWPFFHTGPFIVSRSKTATTLGRWNLTNCAEPVELIHRRENVFHAAFFEWSIRNDYKSHQRGYLVSFTRSEKKKTLSTYFKPWKSNYSENQRT